MKNYLKCIGTRLDMKTDIFWAKFVNEDSEGEIKFEIPVNQGDFKAGGLYRITFTKIEEI